MILIYNKTVISKIYMQKRLTALLIGIIIIGGFYVLYMKSIDGFRASTQPHHHNETHHQDDHYHDEKNEHEDDHDHKA